MTDCAHCGIEMDDEPCWNCSGDGGFHDCGDDVCCCIDKDRITHDCDVCRGEGHLPVCPVCTDD